MNENLHKIMSFSIELLVKSSSKLEDFCNYLDNLRYFASNIKTNKPSPYFLSQFDLLNENLKSKIEDFEMNNDEDINQLIELHYEFLEELKKTKSETKTQEINTECLKCYSWKDNKCINTNECCNCENPELLQYINDSHTLGVCKNCLHLVIKNGNQFLHHRKSYQCKAPYIDKRCGSPKGFKHNFNFLDKKISNNNEIKTKDK